MKKLIYLFLCTLIVLPLTACHAKNNTLENDFKLIECTDEIKGTLNISNLKWSGVSSLLIDKKINSFKAAYPDVEIILNTTEGDDVYAQKISTQLMSGTADDLIDFSALNYYNGIDNGYFVDYYEFIQRDSNFRMDDYYKNVFDAFTYKDGLYAFPINFAYRLIGINRNLPNEVIDNFNKNEGMNFYDALYLYQNIDNKNSLYVEKAFSMYNLILINMNKYVDYENKTCDFDNAEFIQLLKNTRDIVEPGKENFIGINNYSLFDSNVLLDLSTRYAFLEVNCSNVQFLLPPHEPDSYVNFIPLFNINGKLNITSDNAYVMNRKSDNKALAWEFIKFISSDEKIVENEPLDMPLPVSKKAFEKQFTSNIYTVLQILKKYGNSSSDSEALIKDILNKLEIQNEMPMEYINWYPDFPIIIEELTPFIQDVITAEQAAANLQNKMTLKLNE